MIKPILKKLSDKLRRKGIEVNVSVKIGETETPKKEIKKPIYFEKEGK